jgi:hypothetical protein
METNAFKEQNGRSSKRTRQLEQLVAALLQQPNLEQAAKSLGISVSTAYRIRKTPEFQSAYLQARHDAVTQAIARLQQGAGAAASTLLKIMLDPNSPAATRVRAADRVIEHAKRFEREELELRLQRVEKQIATAQRGTESV